MTARSELFNEGHILVTIRIAYALRKHDRISGTPCRASPEPAANAGRLRPDLRRDWLHRVRVRRYGSRGDHIVRGHQWRSVPSRIGVVDLRRFLHQWPEHRRHELALPPTVGLLLDHSGHGPRWSIPAAPVLSRGHWRLLRHKCSDLGFGAIWLRQARDDGRAHADRHGHGGRSVPALWPGSGPCPTQRCCDRRPDGPNLSPPLGGTGARSPYAAADRRAAGWGTGYHRPWPDRCISPGQLPDRAAGRARPGMVVGGHD